MTDKKDKVLGYPPERRVPIEEQDNLSRNFSDMYAGGGLPDRRRGDEEMAIKKPAPRNVWTKAQELELMGALKKVQPVEAGGEATVQWGDFLHALGTLYNGLSGNKVEDKGKTSNGLPFSEAQIRSKATALRTRLKKLTNGQISLSIPKKPSVVNRVTSNEDLLSFFTEK